MCPRAQSTETWKKKNVYLQNKYGFIVVKTLSLAFNFLVFTKAKKKVIKMCYCLFLYFHFD